MTGVITGHMEHWADTTGINFSEPTEADKAAHIAYWANSGMSPPWDYEPPQTETFEPTSVDWLSVNREFS